MNKLVKRIIMSVFGVALCGVSVGMFKFAALGVDPFQSLMSGLDAPLWLRIVFLLVAIVILCLSSSLYFTADLGVSTYDAVALIWSQRQSKIKFAFCRVICDFVCVAAGVALLFASGQDIEQILGSVGIGTIITAFFMGPLITFFNKNVAQKILTAGSK